MDRNLLIILIVIAAIILVFAAVAFLNFAAKKGWKVGKLLNTAEKAIDEAKETLETAKPFIPSSAYNIADLILKYADKGAAMAQQLLKVETIVPDQRKAEAITFVEDSLKIAGIEITPEVVDLISKAIEGAVWQLNNKNVVVVSDKNIASADAPPASPAN